jgi:hypothetical protein
MIWANVLRLILPDLNPAFCQALPLPCSRTSKPVDGIGRFKLYNGKCIFGGNDSAELKRSYSFVRNSDLQVGLGWVKTELWTVMEYRNSRAIVNLKEVG